VAEGSRVAVGNGTGVNDGTGVGVEDGAAVAVAFAGNDVTVACRGAVGEGVSTAAVLQAVKQAQPMMKINIDTALVFISIFPLFLRSGKVTDNLQFQALLNKHIVARRNCQRNLVNCQDLSNFNVRSDYLKSLPFMS
jgi:hypothetical protein